MCLCSSCDLRHGFQTLCTISFKLTHYLSYSSEIKLIHCFPWQKAPLFYLTLEILVSWTVVSIRSHASAFCPPSPVLSGVAGANQLLLHTLSGSDCLLLFLSWLCRMRMWDSSFLPTCLLIWEEQLSKYTQNCQSSLLPTHIFSEGFGILDSWDSGTLLPGTCPFCQQLSTIHYALRLPMFWQDWLVVSHEHPNVTFFYKATLYFSFVVTACLTLLATHRGEI